MNTRRCRFSTGRSERSWAVSAKPRRPFCDEVRLRPQQVHDNLSGGFERDGVPDEGKCDVGVEQIPDADGGGSPDSRRRIAQE